MKFRVVSAIFLALLIVSLSCAALANGSISPWLLNIKDANWGPVPADRLQIQVLASNGNIVTKYHQNKGVLYHSYIGNPDDHVISDDTLTRVVIKPPAGAAYRVDFYCEGISLTQSSDNFHYTGWPGDPAPNLQATVNSPAYYDNILDNKGPVYYDWELPLLKKSSTGFCTPIQRASQNRGNTYLAAWYNNSKQLIRVDWLVETSDDFSIPYADLNRFIYEGYASEDDLPSKITRPSLIIPPSHNNMNFRLGVYYYPSYRGNTDFAELYLMQEKNDLIVPDYDEGSVVLYWPYPEGYSYTSPVHYQLKHYMNNTRTEFEFLDVTPMPKGLRIVTDSFSPFEMSWNEMETIVSLPSTGDSTTFALWAVLLMISIFAVWGMRRRAKA